MSTSSDQVTQTEGPWEDLVRRPNQFADKRVRVTVLPDDCDSPHASRGDGRRPLVASGEDGLPDFIKRHGLASPIADGIKLAAERFNLEEPITARFAVDQETGEEWVELVIVVRGELSEVRQARRHFTKEWLQIVPLEKALLIRPALTVV